ncbi:hypothetical protein Tco_0784361 [Tanacetum coccineum]
MVNTSLKELKRHLTGFDQVVKERTTATAITEGTWGFEHTKACFRDEIIPFIKGLKDIFNNFNQYLVDEIADVQNVFYQMEQAVEQHRLESRTFEVKMNQVLSENERLLAQAIDHDIVKTVVNLSVNDGCETVNECQKCLELKTELLNKKDFVDKETYDKLVRLTASATGSQPSGNTRNDKILQIPSKSSKETPTTHIEYTNQKKLYLLHIGSVWAMRVARWHWKEVDLVIVDDTLDFMGINVSRSKE